jgi:CspA family cold shock protein
VSRVSKSRKRARIAEGGGRQKPVLALIREWHEEEGWGVADAPEFPGGCFVAWFLLDMPGYRTLAPGDEVVIHGWEAARQDGCDFRALRVVPVKPG